MNHVVHTVVNKLLIAALINLSAPPPLCSLTTHLSGKQVAKSGTVNPRFGNNGTMGETEVVIDPIKALKMVFL